MWKYQSTDELYHHGILGQKWGIRRYQNPDGSLTPAGRRRAQKLAEKYAKVTGKKLIVKKKEVQRNEKQKQKTLEEMTDQEIREKLNRFRLEKEYKDYLTSQIPKQQISKGKKFINTLKYKVIAPAFTDAGKDVLTNFLRKKGNDLVYGNNKQDPSKAYANKVKNLELQAKEWQARKNIETNKKQYNEIINKTTNNDQKKSIDKLVNDITIQNKNGSINVSKKALKNMTNEQYKDLTDYIIQDYVKKKK